MFAFVPGELLDYDVRFGPLRLGRLELRTLEPDTARGETCYRFRSTLDVRLGFLFRARYEIETWSRRSDMATMRLWKRTAESRYSGEWQAEFDYEDSVIRYSDGDRFALAGPVHDPLALWYLFRCTSLSEGDSLVVRCHTDRRDYGAVFRPAGHDSVSVPAGRFECLRLVPDPGSPLGALYIAEDAGREPSDRLPVVIRTKVGGMDVSANLRGVETGEGI